MADNDSLHIAMLGHKHMLSREGGIEIVVKELAIRLSARGHKVVVYDRSSSHVSGASVDNVDEYQGVRIKRVAAELHWPHVPFKFSAGIKERG